MYSYAPAGPLLLGYTISMCLYAVLVVQVYIYYAAFPRDSVVIKFLVYFVHLVETVKTGIMAYDLYDTFVTNLGTNPDTLQSMRHIWFSCCIVNGFLAFIVQALYAYRVKILSASCFWGLCIALLACFQLVGALMAGVGGKKIARLDVASVTESTGYIIYKLGGATCDILITVLMSFYLLRMRKHSRMREDVITKIVRLVVGAGALTAVIAVVDVILYFTDTKYGSSWAFRLIIGKLYSNSMMVVFNSRFSFRNNHHNNDSEVAWKSSFFVSVDQINTHEVEARGDASDHKVSLEPNNRAGWVSQVRKIFSPSL